MSAPVTKPDRLEAVDLLRGTIMIIMALDHVRDFWGAPSILNPMDMSTTWPALFFTRWITHYCAPNFIFLAGVGAFLAGTRGQSKRQVAWLLLTRGLWLAIFELTLVQGSWQFNFNPLHYGAGVFWAIGWSMVVLSILVFLPTWMIAAFGVGMIALHNLTDGVTPDQMGALGGLWKAIHAGGEVKLPIELPQRDWNLLPRRETMPDSGPITFGTGYFVIPWCGVMAAGYAFGELLRFDRATRRSWLLILGGLLTAAFFVVRGTNIYGDPHPWELQRNETITALSFLNCTKYPPSLSYLLMTIGPAIFFLGLFDYSLGTWAKPIIVFGRVPMFFYLLHIPLIHGGMVLFDYLRYGWSPQATDGPWVIFSMKESLPSNYGINLIWVYVVWVICIFILYWPCAWFAGVKRRRRDWWLKYI